MGAVRPAGGSVRAQQPVRTARAPADHLGAEGGARTTQEGGAGRGPVRERPAPGRR